MRLFYSILGLVFCLGSQPLTASSELPVAAGDPVAGSSRTDAGAGEAGGGLVVGISPFLDTAAKDVVYRGLVRLIVEQLFLGSKLEVYDAYNLKSITTVSIPNAKVFNSAKTRANQFAQSIAEIKQFLARENAKPAGSKTNFEGVIRLPQFCDFLVQNHASAKISLLLIGSPLYQDAKEPGFSMAEGYFPSDGHLQASREQSVYGYDPGDGERNGLLAYWAYFGDPWLSDLHHEKVERFWALYLGRRGGQLASFSGDFATALGAFNTSAPGPGAASKGWVADARQTKPEMLRATRTVAQVDWLTGDAPSQPSPPPSQMVGPLKIGIRWKENIDLDLYAAPRPEAETLFFNHPISPEGYYFKDHRSSPGHEYEYIEFESPVDVRKVMAFVNFYDGSCPSGPHGEVRIEFLNRVYTGSFAITSPDGNQGRSGRGQANCWAQIPVQEILRLNETGPRAASVAR